MRYLLLLSLVAALQVCGQEKGKGHMERKESFIMMSLAELDASSRLDESKVYWLSDPGREGPFVYAGTAKDQSGDNGGTIIINASLQKFRRIYNGFIDARWFGVTGNATAPTKGVRAQGTDNTPFLRAAIDAAEDGEIVMVPAGRYLFASPLDTIKGPKRVSLYFMGDTYHNGADFIIITNEGGPYEQHTIRHEGTAFGLINLPRHTKATHDDGTAPRWSEFTGTLVKIFNAFQQKVELNRAEGFRTPVEIIGSGGKGSQENTVTIRMAYKNANGLILTSLDGQSYTDKNEFRVGRLSGGLGIKIDGYAGKAKNGEVYNGAARSNKFHILIEQVDSIAECHGDITEPLFDVTVEGGKNTGVFGSVGFRMRSVAPNFVRAPKYTGQGIYEARLLQHGMGLGGMLQVPVWNSDRGVCFGNYALIDEQGNLVFLREGYLPANQQQLAPSHFRFVSFGHADKEEQVTSASYTVAPSVRYLSYRHPSGKVNLPPAANFPGREITIYNDHEQGRVSIEGIQNKSFNIPPGGTVTLRSNGTRWRAVSNF